jgi:hypothetical protein
MKYIKDRILMALGFTACIAYVILVLRMIKYFWEL